MDPVGRLVAGVAVLALLLIGAQPDRPQLREVVAQAMTRMGVDPDRVDLDALVDEATRSAGGPDDVSDFVFGRLSTAMVPGAGWGARHDSSARYVLPYPLRVPRLLSNGTGDYNHRGFEHDCFDFLLPRGEPVLAAREGIVEVAIGHHTRGGPDQSLPGNTIVILHDDGTYALYYHLDGVDVKRGDRVRPREPIGRSGFTGWGNGPHLHFCVFAVDEAGLSRSVPIRFGPRGRPGLVLKTGTFYPAPLPASRRLRLRVDGQTAKGSIARRPGESFDLGVEYVAPDGSVTDVTRDPRTRFEAKTLWSAEVTAEGRVTLRPTPGFEAMEVAEQFAEIVILYQPGARGRPEAARLHVDLAAR